MSETNFRHYVRDGLSKYGHIVQVENSILPGHPDTNYCIRSNSIFEELSEGQAGDMELKYIKEWPKREKTVVKIDHYTKEQRIWIFKRAMAFGSVFLFVQVKNEYFLFGAFAAVEMVGKALTKQHFYTHHVHYWDGRINFKELVGILCRWKNYQQEERDLLKKSTSMAVQFI